MQVETKFPLRQLHVYVMREFEAEKKLQAKDPISYGVGPTRITKLDISQLPGMFYATCSRAKSVAWYSCLLSCRNSIAEYLRGLNWKR